MEAALEKKRRLSGSCYIGRKYIFFKEFFKKRSVSDSPCVSSENGVVQEIKLTEISKIITDITYSP